MTVVPEAGDLISQLRRQGVVVTIRDGRLRFEAPPGVLSVETKSRIRERKQELLQYVEQEQRLLGGAGLAHERPWAPAELRALASLPGLTQREIEGLGRLRAAFGIEIISVDDDTQGTDDTAPLERSPSTCFMCRDQRFWVSVYGVTVCATCHPPADEDLVAEWIDGAASKDDTPP